MGNKELRQKKMELKGEWEDCFEKRFEAEFSKEDVDKFWNDNTTEAEAIEMLTDYAIAGLADDIICTLLGKAFKDMGIKAVVIAKPKEAEAKEKDSGDFGVFDTKKQEFVVEGIDTYENANEAAKNYCLEHGVRLVDVKVVQMYD